MGLVALSAGEPADTVVSDPVWLEQCAPAEHWDCGTGPAVTDRSLALSEDGGTPRGRSAHGSGVRRGRLRGHPEPEEGDNGFGLVCGPLVAGHGFAGRTDYEEGLPTLGFTGAQSACRIGCVTQRGQHG